MKIHQRGLSHQIKKAKHTGSGPATKLKSGGIVQDFWQQLWLKQLTSHNMFELLTCALFVLLSGYSHHPWFSFLSSPPPPPPGVCTAR